MQRIKERTEQLWEAHYPTLMGLVGLAGSLVWGPALFKHARIESWHIDQLYVGVFTVLTVVTGLLFAFYTFIATSDRGFLGRAKRTIYYKAAIRYFTTAMLAGALTIAVSLPFLVVQPAPETRSLALLCVSSWVALAAWSLASAERATRIFTIFTQQAD